MHNMTHSDLTRHLNTEVCLNLWSLGKGQLRPVSLDSRGNENLKVFGSGTVINCTTCSQIGQNKAQTRETQKTKYKPKAT